MDERNGSLIKMFQNYSEKLQALLRSTDWKPVEHLAKQLYWCWQNNKNVFLCGNGGSAGNAIHLANDFLYGVATKPGSGIKVNALSSNPAVLTCLGNDVGYDAIFSHQLAVLAETDDLLIVLSGSGNSENIIKALEEAKRMSVKTCAILGYSGGKAKEISDIAVHFPIADMQISEDMQLVVGHMLMRWLWNQSIDN